MASCDLKRVICVIWLIWKSSDLSPVISHYDFPSLIIEMTLATLKVSVGKVGSYLMLSTV